MTFFSWNGREGYALNRKGYGWIGEVIFGRWNEREGYKLEIASSFWEEILTGA